MVSAFVLYEPQSFSVTVTLTLPVQMQLGSDCHKTEERFYLLTVLR